MIQDSLGKLCLDLLLLRIETLINPVLLLFLCLSWASSEKFNHFMNVHKYFAAYLRVILLHNGLFLCNNDNYSEHAVMTLNCTSFAQVNV